MGAYASSSASGALSASSSSSIAAAVLPTSSPSSTAVSGGQSTSSLASESSKSWSETIAIGILSGIIGLAGLVALTAWFLRRRKHQEKQCRAPSFTSSFGSGNPAGGKFFQKIRTYPPDDFGLESPQIISNELGTTNNRPSMGTSQYRQREALSEPDSQPAQREISQTTPLVTDIDDFSRDFSAAIAEERALQEEETHIHTGELPDTPNGVGFGAGRSSRRGADDHHIAIEGLRLERSTSEPPPIPPRSPWRLTSSSKRDSDDGVQRDQLTDPGAAGDDVPIVNRPGRLRSATDFGASRAPKGMYN